MTVIVGAFEQVFLFLTPSDSAVSAVTKVTKQAAWLKGLGANVYGQTVAAMVVIVVVVVFFLDCIVIMLVNSLKLCCIALCSFLMHCKPRALCSPLCRTQPPAPSGFT